MVVRAVIAIISITLLLIYVRPANLIPVIDRLNHDWILASALCIVTSTIIGAFNVYLFISHDNRMSPLSFLGAYWMSWAAGLIVPGQVGDVASLTLLLRRHGLDWPKVAGRAVLDKSISLVVMLAFASFGLTMILGDGEFTEAVVVAVIVFVTSLIVLGVALAMLSPWLTKRKWRILSYISVSLQDMRHLIHAYPVRLAANFVLTFVKIVLIGFAYWCMFTATGLTDVTALLTIALAAVSSIVAYIPISINGIGVAESTGLAVFSAVGATSATTLTVYLALRLVVFALAWIPSFAIIFFTRHPRNQTPRR